MTPLTSRHVAVIGAGFSGLAAAKELRREGHRVVVFERSNHIGGTWIYTPETESDPLGIDPTRSVVHSSLYRSLRTNLPREVMGFRDYPFVPRTGRFRNRRRFPDHREVLNYLQDYASEFGIGELVRFETEVVRVGLVGDGKWSGREGELVLRLGSSRRFLMLLWSVMATTLSLRLLMMFQESSIGPGSKFIAIIIVFLSPSGIKELSECCGYISGHS